MQLLALYRHPKNPTMSQRALSTGFLNLDRLSAATSAEWNNHSSDQLLNICYELETRGKDHVLQGHLQEQHCLPQRRQSEHTTQLTYTCQGHSCSPLT